MLKRSLVAMLFSFWAFGAVAQAVSIQQIVQGALKQYPGRLVELEREHEKGQQTYQLKIRLAQGQLQKLTYLTTGKLLKSKLDDEQFPVVPANILPLEKVLASFQSHYHGAVLSEIELKATAAGSFQYHLEWKNAKGQKWKQLQDARTGKILSQNQDY